MQSERALSEDSATKRSSMTISTKVREMLNTLCRIANLPSHEALVKDMIKVYIGVRKLWQQDGRFTSIHDYVASLTPVQQEIQREEEENARDTNQS